MKIKLILAIFVFWIFCPVVIAQQGDKTTSPSISEKNEEQEMQELRSKVQNTSKQLKREKKQIAQEIKNYEERRNVDIYIGKGVVEIEKDPEKATEEAKKIALDDLARSIRVKIRSTVQDELKYGTGAGTEQKFEMITNAYAAEVLRRVVVKSYPDYPKNGKVTVICYVNIKDYEEAVQEEIRKDLAQISKYAIEGMKAYQQKLYVTALENFSVGKQRLRECFYDLPALEDIDNDGHPDDLYAFFDTNIIKIIRGIKLEPVAENVIYGVDGKLWKYPVVRVAYEESGEKTPIEGMKLRAKFIEGKDQGEIAPEPLVTNKLGEVPIPVERVNPAYKSVKIQVELDPQALNIDEKQVPISYCLINIRKRKMFACAVNFFNAGRKGRCPAVANSLKAVLRKMEYEVVDYRIEDEQMMAEVIPELSARNFDYVILVSIYASGGQVGDYQMFYSDISSKASIYSLPEGALVSSVEDGPSAKGYGTSLAGAGSNALEKIKDKLVQRIQEELKGLN